MDNTKQCTKCGNTRPLSEFRFKNKQQGILQQQCKTCCKEQGKQYYVTNKVSVIAKQRTRNDNHKNKYHDFKTTLSCVSCRESAPYCLEFHHLDSSTKDYNIGNMTNQHWNTVKKELSKCVCLCANCHRKVHHQELDIQDEWLTGPHSLMERALDFESSR